MFKKDKKEESAADNPFGEENEAENQETTENNQAESTEKADETNSILEKLKEDKETLDAQYIRLAADFDNYRKRQEQERESLLKYGAEDTLKKLLPVIDTLERAQKSLKEVDDPEKLKESFEAVNKQFIDTLEKIGVEKIKTEGETFDPNIHEAVMQTPSSEHPDHTIITELQSGYKLHDRIIRPALVNVAVCE